MQQINERSVNQKYLAFSERYHQEMKGNAQRESVSSVTQHMDTFDKELYPEYIDISHKLILNV